MDFRQNIILISSLTCLVLQIISSNVVHWTKYNFMTHLLTCKPSKILFYTENVHDPSECTKMCFMQNNCLVVTFIPELNKCVGCQEYRHAGINQTSAEIQYSIRPAHGRLSSFENNWAFYDRYNWKKIKFVCILTVCYLNYYCLCKFSIFYNVKFDNCELDRKSIFYIPL
jgi:hypothetical protein